MTGFHSRAAGGALALCAARLLMTQVAAQTSSQTAAPPVDFQRQIRPILSDNCFQCHGPDSAARQADLRLDLRESALKARPNGAPIVPGKSADSLLYQRVSDADATFRMPPPDSRKQLTAAQVALLKRWIDSGAPWKEHWAFRRPSNRSRPSTPRQRWRAGPQPDRLFILGEARREGTRPQADQRPIRRVALIPRPAAQALEIRTFLQDTSPRLRAYGGGTTHLAPLRRTPRALLMPRATATRTAYMWTTTGRSGLPRLVIAAFNRNLPLTNSASINWPAISCPTPRSTNASPQASNDAM